MILAVDVFVVAWKLGNLVDFMTSSIRMPRRGLTLSQVNTIHKELKKA